MASNVVAKSSSLSSCPPAESNNDYGGHVADILNDKYFYMDNWRFFGLLQDEGICMMEV